MQESLSTIKTAEPVTLMLSPRDLFVLHAACEASVLEIIRVEFLDNELYDRMHDLERRIHQLLLDRGIGTSESMLEPVASIDGFDHTGLQPEHDPEFDQVMREFSHQEETQHVD